MASGMLLAAEEVFAESGLAKAHVEDIARRAGVSVGTLYNYYKDRDGLLAAVVSERIGELIQELDAAVARTLSAPIRSAMLELGRAYLRFVIQRRTFMRILVEGELLQLKESYPTSAALKEQCWKGLIDLFGEVMGRGVANGELPGATAEVDVWLFLGLLRGIIMRDLRGDTRCQESDAERAVKVFFDGALA